MHPSKSPCRQSHPQSPLQVEEGVQHGIIGSKRFHVVFKRGLPLQDKIVYFSGTIECTSRNTTVCQLYLYMLYLSSKAERVPANQHPSTPDEVKVVHSDDRIGTFVPSILTRRVALPTTGQLPLKRPSEGPDNENGGFSTHGNGCFVPTAQCHFLLQVLVVWAHLACFAF